MRCPTCKKDFHPQADFMHTYWADMDQDSKKAELIYGQKCPSCYSLVVGLQSGVGRFTNEGVVLEVVEADRVIYPTTKDGSLPDEVPQGYRQDFDEAKKVLEISKKASAALSRRLIQKVFREQLGIKARDLSGEIDAFLASEAPGYLTDAIDAVRHIGNFAAHPLKYTQTGEIVEVEEGEAEWTLQVVEALLDFSFVQPARLAQRRESLNRKLEALGKPPMKGRA